MTCWLWAAFVAAGSTLAAAAPPPQVPIVVAPPPLVKIAPPPVSVAKPLVKPTEAEALALVRAYSPSDLRRRAELVILEKNFVPGLKAAPGMAAMLEAYPQLGEELKKAMAGQIDLYVAEYDERFFPRATAIIQESLSREDVAALTAFYASPTGRKAQEMAINHVDGTEVMERAAKGEGIDSGVAARQAMRAGIKTYGELSESERATMRELIMSPAGRNFSAMMSKMAALQAELANDPGPRFKASTDKALSEAFKRVTGLDFKGP